MRYYRNRGGYTITFSARDANDFSNDWPGSSVGGGGSFEFNDYGDLTKATGSAKNYQGSDWEKFLNTCRTYGAQKNIEYMRSR
jgi:hypothetical protein